MKRISQMLWQPALAGMLLLHAGAWASTVEDAQPQADVATVLIPPSVPLSEAALPSAKPGDATKVEVSSTVTPASAASGGLLALGGKPIPSQQLAQRRGGSSDVFNDMQLKGVVSDNRAVNVSTGANWVTEGSLAGAVGIPMLVQNTGNNVLIQNATIINLQLK